MIWVNDASAGRHDGAIASGCFRSAPASIASEKCPSDKHSQGQVPLSHRPILMGAPMTHLFNDPAEFRSEVLEGFAAAYPQYVQRVTGASGFVRAGHSRAR